MVLIRCTAKLRKEMGLRPADLRSESPQSQLGDWYAHLFFEKRKKCVLFVSERTLLCFLAVGLKRDRLRRLDEVFRDGFFRLLLDEGFQPEQATPAFNGCREMGYAATSDRSMVGTVNELVRETQFLLPRHGGVASPDLASLYHKMNRTPLKRNGYEYAIVRAKNLLSAQPPS